MAIEANILTATSRQRVDSLAVALQQQGAPGDLTEIAELIELAAIDVIRSTASRRKWTPKPLMFIYTNWRGQTHEYLVRTDRPGCGVGMGIADTDRGQLVLHAEIVARDGDSRPGMGPTRRRTFLISGMRDVKEVE